MDRPVGYREARIWVHGPWVKEITSGGHDVGTVAIDRQLQIRQGTLPDQLLVERAFVDRGAFHAAFVIVG